MREKRVIAGALIGVVLLLVGGNALAGADANVSAQVAIRAALESWTKDFNARDASRVCTLFAPDLISNYRGQPERDYNSLCAQLKRSISDPARSYHYDLDLEEILVSGDMAAVRLVWTLKVHKQGESKSMTIEEPGLDVFRRQTDGTWKIARFIAYESPGS